MDRVIYVIMKIQWNHRIVKLQSQTRDSIHFNIRFWFVCVCVSDCDFILLFWFNAIKMGSFSIECVFFTDAEIVYCWYCRLNLRNWIQQKKGRSAQHHKEMSWACGIFWTQNQERKYIKCIMQQVLLSERQYHFIFLYNVMAFVMCVCSWFSFSFRMQLNSEFVFRWWLCGFFSLFPSLNWELAGLLVMV